MTEADQLQARSTRPRVLQLDALRGLAAISVLFSHLRFALHSGDPKWYLLPLFSGTSSVMLFFVLSGYVLSLPYWTGKPMRYLPYIAKRTCRIYLPFAVALLLSLLGAWHFRHVVLRLTPWFELTWHSPITKDLIVSQFLMNPTPDLNTALWSIRFELQLSFAMPVLCALLRRGSAVLITSLGAIYFWLAWAWPRWVSDCHLDQTFGIAVLFAMGATLAKNEETVRNLMFRLGRLRLLVLFFALVLFWQFSSRLGTHRMSRTGPEMLCGIGALGLICLALNISALARFLEHPVLEYLGRVSFSLYLVHGTVLFAAFYLLYGKVRVWELYACVVLLSFFVAHLFCRLIEEPAIRLGKHLAERMA